MESIPGDGKIASAMSGHSKWATTHRQKEVKDSKKGVVFTKLAMAIVVAVREGGGIGDPDKNFRLRLVVEKARQLNMPKENISRAIDKGMGGAGAGEVHELMYEGFLPGGSGVLVEVVTDNKARTAQMVRSVLERHGGSLGGAGSVVHMFAPMGLVVADVGGKNQDEVELALIDAGAADIEIEGTKLVVYCERHKIFEMKEVMEKMGLRIETAEALMKPVVWMEVGDAQVKDQIEQCCEALDDLDDVAHVYTNYQPV
jgi:YebC/PmpR family DNA-binding regulatory protein